MSAPIHKIDPSPLTPIGKRLARALIPLVPRSVTPNQVTGLGCLAYLLAGGSFFLAGSGPAWFLVAALATFLHWLLDELDGELARARQLSSERGFFLDFYLDAVGAAAISLGLTFSGNVPPLLPLLLLTVFLLAALLSMLHVVLRQEFPLGRIGPSESQVFLIALAVVSFFQSSPVLTLGGLALTWFGLALAAALPVCLIQLTVYAVRFYRRLDPVGGSP